MRIEFKSQPSQRATVNELVTQWLLNALGLLIVSRLSASIRFHGEDGEVLLTLLAAAAVLGLLNLLLKPFLLLITLPITILTLGLFMLVINAIVLLSAAALVRGFEVSGFGGALWGALLLSLITLLLGAFIPGSGRLKIERDA